MTPSQLKILKATLIGIVVTMLFPPFVLNYGGGAMHGKGFGFLLSWPEDGIIHTELLLVEWLAIGLIARLLWAIDSKRID